MCVLVGRCPKTPPYIDFGATANSQSVAENSFDYFENRF